MTKSNRGGKREGAGRPKTGNVRIKTSVSIDPELYEWVKNQPGSISNTINQALKFAKRFKNVEQKESRTIVTLGH